MHWEGLEQYLQPLPHVPTLTYNYLIAKKAWLSVEEALKGVSD